MSVDREKLMVMGDRGRVERLPLTEARSWQRQDDAKDYDVDELYWVELQNGDAFLVKHFSLKDGVFQARSTWCPQEWRIPAGELLRIRRAGGETPMVWLGDPGERSYRSKSNRLEPRDAYSSYGGVLSTYIPDQNDFATWPLPEFPERFDVELHLRVDQSRNDFWVGFTPSSSDFFFHRAPEKLLLRIRGNHVTFRRNGRQKRPQIYQKLKRMPWQPQVENRIRWRADASRGFSALFWNEELVHEGLIPDWQFDPGSHQRNFMMRGEKLPAAVHVERVEFHPMGPELPRELPQAPEEGVRIQFINGDRFEGQLLSVDDSEIRFVPAASALPTVLPSAPFQEIRFAPKTVAAPKEEPVRVTLHNQPGEFQFRRVEFKQGTLRGYGWLSQKPLLVSRENIGRILWPRPEGVAPSPDLP